MGVAMAAIRISAAPTQPISVGTLTSGNRPGAQLPSMACWMVLSSPSRAAAKQQMSQTEEQHEKGPAAPIHDVFPVPNGISQKAQQDEEHDRGGGGHAVSEIKLHAFPSSRWGLLHPLDEAVNVCLQLLNDCFFVFCAVVDAVKQVYGPVKF